MYIGQQRQLPPDDFNDPRLTKLPTAARHLATSLRMMSFADYRGPLNVYLIRALAWPAGPDGEDWPTLPNVETYLLMLDEVGFLTIYADPESPAQSVFQIIARTPHVSRQDYSTLPPPPEKSPSVLSGKIPGGGGSARAGVSGRVREGEGEGPKLSGSPELPVDLKSVRSLHRLPPSPFCSDHIGGPPEHLRCPDCGTARNRHTRYVELRTALQDAMGLDPVLRQAVVKAIEDEMRVLEEAAAAALMGARDSEDPTEYVDEDGRIETT